MAHNQRLRQGLQPALRQSIGEVLAPHRIADLRLISSNGDGED